MTNAIIFVIIYVGGTAAAFLLGWLFAVYGLISETAFEILDKESFGKCAIRLMNMIRAHWVIFKRRWTNQKWFPKKG